MFEGGFINAAMASMFKEFGGIFGGFFEHAVCEGDFFFLFFSAEIGDAGFFLFAEWDGQACEIDGIAVFSQDFGQFRVKLSAMWAVEAGDFDDIDFAGDIE